MKSWLRRMTAWLAIVIMLPGLAAQADDAAAADHDDRSKRGLVTKPVPPEYVGSSVCAGCHAAEATAWRSSDHYVAMQAASQHTVLGGFHDRDFMYAGRKSTFFTRGDRFFVRTDGPDGQSTEFGVSHTFGAWPLQQYLIPLPGGRYQALGIAWDARPHAAGGQRWFHLYPDRDINHTHPLHWTRPEQNWNNMCAECHSTALRKRYAPGQGTYDTRFTEMNVACEACHGPGGQHVRWAKLDPDQRGPAAGLSFGKGEPAKWLRDQASANAHRSTPLGSRMEIETCGRCHSRRAALGAAATGPLLDAYSIPLLDADLYHPDGQIDAEVFEYGSFLQSKMYAAGVVCSDCHDPHSQKLRTRGDQVCSRCHEDGHYRSKAHHLHEPQSIGSDCIACHMPQKKYMVIDARHDHSFRIPRPDLSLELGTPNACTSCHADKPMAWAAEVFARRYPKRVGTAHYGQALYAARMGRAGADKGLSRLIGDSRIPAIVRATALSMLPDYAAPETGSLLAHGLADPDPLPRIAALRALADIDVRLALRLAPVALADEVRAVRIEAARALMRVPRDAMPEQIRTGFDDALREYVAAQAANADRAFAHTNLGVMFAMTGDLARAEAAYLNAMKLEPDFVQAPVNLADLYRHRGRDDDAEALLLKARDAAPSNAAVHHALGLLKIRQRQSEEALSLFARATELDPSNWRFAYVYAVALHDGGRVAEAIDVLTAAHHRRPAERTILDALNAYEAERNGPAQE